MTSRSSSATLLLACCLVGASGATTVNANETAFVTLLGRTYPAGAGGVGLSWLGAGVRVSHTGKTLRATFGATPSSFKVAFTHSVTGYMPWQGVSLVAGSGVSETVVVGNGQGTIDMVLNFAPQYFEALGSATLLTLTTDGEFNPAPAPPTRVMHMLGDSITASTNIHGGVQGCADGGYQDDFSSSYSGILCPFFGADCSESTLSDS